MHTSIIRSTGLLILSLLLLLGVATGVKAHNQQEDGVTAVTLASYSVTPLNNAVRINWSTGSELGTQGFRIQRGAPGGPYEYLNALGDDPVTGIIESQGDVIFGASYERIDNTVLNGETWTYILIEVEDNGSEIEPNDARRTVTVGVQPTNTPVVAQVNTPGTPGSNTPTATATTAAGASQTPTAVTNSTAVPGGNPTATRFQFATITSSAPINTSPTEAPALTAVPVVTNGEDTTSALPRSDNAIQSTPLPVESGANPIATPDNVALAQEVAAAALPAAQDGYPGGEPTAALENPNTLPVTEPTATPSGLAVIGSSQGYESADNATTAAAPATPSNARNTLFLWIGFVVALLIFITGVVGTLVLYTRRTR